jgi:hypothetical protein
MSLEIPPPAGTDQPETGEEVIAQLRALRADCGPNENEQLLMVITAFLDEGPKTRSQIIRTVERVGFKRSHIAALLDKSTGTNPARHCFKRRADGRYEAHN